MDFCCTLAFSLINRLVLQMHFLPPIFHFWWFGNERVGLFPYPRGGDFDRSTLMKELVLKMNFLPDYQSFWWLGMSILMVARNRNCNEPLNWDDTMQWYLTVKLRRGTTWIITNSAFTREDRVSSLWILKTESRSRNVMFKSLFYSFFCWFHGWLCRCAETSMFQDPYMYAIVSSISIRCHSRLSQQPRPK